MISPFAGVRWVATKVWQAGRTEDRAAIRTAAEMDLRINILAPGSLAPRLRRPETYTEIRRISNNDFLEKHSLSLCWSN